MEYTIINTEEIRVIIIYLMDKELISFVVHDLYVCGIKLILIPIAPRIPMIVIMTPSFIIKLKKYFYMVQLI